MDLDSWKPSDMYRRISVAISVQIAVFVGCALVLAAGWPWYVGILAALILGGALHQSSMWLRGRRSRERGSS